MATKTDIGGENKDKIIVKGARTHNLKNVTVEMPRNKMVVFTGLSGSGKSSLAFDTILRKANVAMWNLSLHMLGNSFDKCKNQMSMKLLASLRQFLSTKNRVQTTSFKRGNHYRNLRLHAYFVCAYWPTTLFGLWTRN